MCGGCPVWVSMKTFQIAGLQKLSTIDFPDMLAAVVFTQGCNFHCKYCHNPELIGIKKGNQGFLSKESLLCFLEKRKKFLDGVVISGGEPTLQEGLAEFCLTIQQLGFKVKLDSNGSNPEVINTLLEVQAVDYFAIDCKAPPNKYYPDFSHDVLINKKLVETAHLLQKSSVAHEFRTTCIAPFVTKDNLQDMCKLVGQSPWYFQQGRLVNCEGMLALPKERIEELVEIAKNLGAKAFAR